MELGSFSVVVLVAISLKHTNFQEIMIEGDLGSGKTPQFSDHSQNPYNAKNPARKPDLLRF